MAVTRSKLTNRDKSPSHVFIEYDRVTNNDDDDDPNTTVHQHLY